MEKSRGRLCALLIVVLACTAHAQPRGVFKFVSTDVANVLDAYQSMTGVQLVIAPDAQKGKITLQSQGPTSAQEAALMIERALIEQAGVVITPLGDRRASVTYDDVLARQAMARLANNTPPTPQYEVRGEVSWIGREGV